MSNYKICSTCILDTSISEIEFDESGVCNFCRAAEEILPQLQYSKEDEVENLNRMFSKVKRTDGKYDSILGLSGGVDSSYVALLAKRMGLNPLAVHFDNGWNSELAISNIEKIVEKCGFDLQTVVIDWTEFRELQRSFIKAGVVDIELLTDHAIFASLFKIRRKFNIKYVLSGTNYRTEHGMPDSWVWLKTDKKNILDIQKQFGDSKLKDFPMMNTLKWKLMLRLGLGGTFVEPLNVINYSKHEAIAELEKEFDWRYYGGKHYESVFTKFYQAYILPNKFGIDKRKVHFSDLIRNQEITREEALVEINKPVYDQKELKVEKEYVLKKLGFSEKEFDALMLESPRSHGEFKNEIWIKELFTRIRKRFKAKTWIERIK